MDKILRNVDQELWRQAKARAALEGITLKQLVENALQLRLGYKSKRPAAHLKKQLPNGANCADCGKEVFKSGASLRCQDNRGGMAK